MGLLTEMVVSNLYMFRTVAELIYLDVSRDTVSPMTYIMAVLLCSTPIFAGRCLVVSPLAPAESSDRKAAASLCLSIFAGEESNVD